MGRNGNQNLPVTLRNPGVRTLKHTPLDDPRLPGSDLYLRRSICKLATCQTKRSVRAGSPYPPG